MSLLPFIHFFTFVLLMYHAVYILFKNPKALLNRVCAAFIFCFGIWSFAYMFVHNPYSSRSTANLFVNISSLGWAGFASLFLWFILVFTQKKALLKKIWLYLVLLGVPLVFIYVQWTNFLYVDVFEKPYGWKAMMGQSIWPYLFLLYAFIFPIMALAVNFSFMRSTRDPILKKQAKIIFIFTVITFSVGFLTDIALPLLNIHVIPNVANVYALIWTVGAVYAMVKYKFLTITPATAADNIISTMFDCLILLNMEGEIVTVNKAVENLSGYKAEQLKGKPLSILFGKEKLPSELLKKTSGKSHIKNEEMMFRTREGKDIPMLFSDSILRDETGTAAGIVCVAKDISERKKLEEEVFKGKKLQSIGVLAGGIAHDFNHLLSVIVGNIMRVKDDTSPGENAYKFLLQSEQAALKAAELAEKFITFSPGGWLIREKLLVGSLLKGLLDSEPGLRDTDVSYHIDISRHLAPIYGDKGQLNQVMQNLLLNAVEAIAAGAGGSDGRISIRAENSKISSKNQFQLKPGNYVKVSIEDNGTGIPAEIMDQVFDPYFSTKERGTQKGMGLGLTLCYWIIKRHDGHIRLESQQGKGTTVILYLPAFTQETD
ncbi:MAG: ATP-binding protein [Candidatus Aminicenantes bacterium]|jgi:PAS domain S-box-containing protein